MLPPTLAGFAAAAEAAMEPGPYGYYAGGSGDEITLRDNVAAWSRLALRPRVLVDVSSTDPSTVLLGRERAHPIVVAPTAFHSLATPDCEPATARAALATDSIHCLSTLASTAPADLATAVPEVSRWFQVYVFKDRGVTRAMVDSAVEHGYEALVLTVDMPVLGRRERDLHTGFQVTEPTSVPSVGATGEVRPLTMVEVAALNDPTLTWDEVGRLAEMSGLPVLVKGVLTGEDGRLAVESGAAGVVVSNHGGRQLDTVLSGADALPEVVEAVAGAIDVLVDGGIRRGTDVVKALALGADAVMVGRPILWGLAVGGAEGAERVIELLLGELATALALVGCPRARELGPAHVQRAPW